MTHKPVNFLTFKALRNESILSSPPDERGENCVNFGWAFCKKAGVICVNFAAGSLLRQARS
ncbi:hypothetical protein [Sphingorhabdus sp. EL138]|uniref:hypothetical protein n=1 Tax=Sphingorhabdus sp. EL138 TaxID=2073156 RepID=UPI0013A5A784|nr:hypothetical protein [Sphingorhabdus sp. EL138]